jgi:hypothetical protein
VLSTFREKSNYILLKKKVGNNCVCETDSSSLKNNAIITFLLEPQNIENVTIA